jgi:thioredoxin 1
MKKIKYFTASWCGPCKFFKPTLQELIDEGVDVEILDIDSNPEETASNDIMSVPTLIFQKDNEDYARVSGLVSKEHIQAILDG